MRNSSGSSSSGRKKNMTTRALAYCALLMALSVVFARLIVPMPNEFTRFSIEAVPIYISGLLFGPMAGGFVGFGADLIGCLFSGYGYNPAFCIPPILYGVAAGLFRRFVVSRKDDNINIVRLIIAFLVPIVLGSILYQSTMLSLFYTRDEGFRATFAFFLTSRSIQFAVTAVIDVLLIFLLFRTGMFKRLNVWPPKSKRKISDEKEKIS